MVKDVQKYLHSVEKMWPFYIMHLLYCMFMYIKTLFSSYTVPCNFSVNFSFIKEKSGFKRLPSCLISAVFSEHYVWKARYEGTTENSHTGQCAHTWKVLMVKRKMFVIGNNTCTIFHILQPQSSCNTMQVYIRNMVYFTYIIVDVDPSGRAVWGVGLQPLDCRDGRLESC